MYISFIFYYVEIRHCQGILRMGKGSKEIMPVIIIRDIIHFNGFFFNLSQMFNPSNPGHTKSSTYQMLNAEFNILTRIPSQCCIFHHIKYRMSLSLVKLKDKA